MLSLPIKYWTPPPLGHTSPLVGKNNRMFKRPTSYVMQFVLLLCYLKIITRWCPAAT